MSREVDVTVVLEFACVQRQVKPEEARAQILRVAFVRPKVHSDRCTDYAADLREAAGGVERKLGGETHTRTCLANDLPLSSERRPASYRPRVTRARRASAAAAC